MANLTPKDLLQFFSGRNDPEYFKAVKEFNKLTPAGKEQYIAKLSAQFQKSSAEEKKPQASKKNVKKGKTGKKQKIPPKNEDKDKIRQQLAHAWLETADRNAPGYETTLKLVGNQIAQISDLPAEERENAIKEFLVQCTSKKEKTMTEENKPMTEEEKQNIVKEMELRKKARENLGITGEALSSGADALEEKLIKSWADTHKVTLTHNLRNAAIEHLKSHSSLDNFMTDMPVKQEPKKFKVDEPELSAAPAPRQKEKEEEKETAPYDEQLQGIKKHWEKWCADTKDENNQPLRNFKEIPNEDGFLKFEIEPTEALKAQNPEAKGAEVTYYSETEATMPMTDYDYFYQMAKAAKEVSHADVIECGEIKTPGYATRLIAAAYANGLEVEKAPKPNEIDLSNETLKGIKEDTILTVLEKQFFNRDSNTAEKVDYESIKKALRVYKDIQEHQKDENGNPKGPMKSLDVSKMRFTDEAAKNKTIAAALEMGLKIEGVDKLNLNQETKEGIPEEAARLLGTMQVGLLRAKAQKLHDPNTSQEEREALKTEKMKQFDAKDKTRLIQEQKAKLSSKEATKEEKNIAATRLDTLQGKRWEQGYHNRRGGRE